jgi:transcriptional regulator with XRE-family HTH domain
MPQPSALSIVLLFLRRGEGWSQTRLAAAAGVLPSLINDYENARKPLTRGRVEFLIGLLGLPPETIDDTLDCLAGNRAAARAPGAPADRFVQTRRHIASLSGQVGRLASGFCRSLLTLLTVEGEALYSRQLAETQFARLKKRPFAERRLLVAESR